MKFVGTKQISRENPLESIKDTQPKYYFWDLFLIACSPCDTSSSVLKEKKAKSEKGKKI
jgi:hypothetical protein